MSKKQTKLAAQASATKAAQLVVLVAALLYFPTATFDFTFDDHVIVERNPAISELGHWKALLWADYWPEMRTALYRPITLVSFALGRMVHGASPAGHHLVNILLHSAASYLVCRISSLLFASPAAALAAALLFAVHPIHAEAVCGVVGRAELLSSLLALAVFWIWIRPAKKALSGGAPWAGSLLFLLALGAKENVIVLPALIFMWEAAPSRQAKPLQGVLQASWQPRFWLMITAAAVFLLLRAGALGGWAASFNVSPPFVENPLARVPLSERVFSGLAYQARGFILQLFPHPLIADYSYRTLAPVISWWNWQVLGTLAGAAGVASLALTCKPAARRLAFALGWYLISILPASNIFFPIGTIFAERLFYFPSVGLCLAFGAICDLLLHNGTSEWKWPPAVGQRTCLGVASALLLLMGTVTEVRIFDWRNDLSLFTDTVAKAPQNVKARLWLGDSLVLAGRAAEAVKQYRKALEIYPEYAAASANMMVPLMTLGQFSEAASIGEKARSLFPQENVVLLLNLANAWLESGNTLRFLEYIQRAIELDPNNAEARVRLGLYHLRQSGNRALAPSNWRRRCD